MANKTRKNERSTPLILILLGLVLLALGGSLASGEDWTRYLGYINLAVAVVFLILSIGIFIQQLKKNKK